MRICYLVSEYPAVSHTFIRREVVELERNGISVLRVSLRGHDRELVDPDDIAEKARTRYILDSGLMTFVVAFFHALVRSPRKLAKATLAAIGMMRPSSRPAPLHLAYLAEALVLAHWVTDQKVQHIHARFGTNGAEVAMLCHLLTGVPYSFGGQSRSMNIAAMRAGRQAIVRRYAALAADYEAAPDVAGHERYLARQLLRGGARRQAASISAALAFRHGRWRELPRAAAALVAPRVTDRIGQARAAAAVPASWCREAEL